MVGELGRKTLMRLIGLGGYQDAGCILVEAVDDAGSPHATNSLEAAAAMVKKCVDQCAVPVSRCRMNHHSRRLVDYNEMLVLVQDFQRNGFGPGFCIIGFRNLQDQRIIRLEAVTGLAQHLAIATDRAFLDQRLDARARDMGRHLVGEPGIEALAGINAIDHELLRQVFPFVVIRYRRRHHEVLPQMLGCEHEQGGFAMNAREAIEEEKPLDPATERVRRKMVRLLVVSISVMMVGLMAVLGAVVYKINDKPAQSLAANNGAKVPMEPGFEGRIDLPPGAEMIASSLDGSNILLSVRLAGGDSQLLVYSLAEDRIVARVAID